MGHNHDGLMVCKETPIAEKILKLFPDENIVLKILTVEKQIFGLKIMIVLLKLIKEIMKIII